MFQQAMLDPQYPDFSLSQLDELVDLSPGTLLGLRRVVALYPRPTTVLLDESYLEWAEGTPFSDPFTFQIETDDLLLFSRDETVCINALVEMAMYLTGFATLIGCEDEWVTEFAIGAWKGVRNHLKRQLDLPVMEGPIGVVGQPPSMTDLPGDDPYPFRTLVSSFDPASFYHMIALAGREELTVYFPPETSPKVLAAYIYSRRAMHEIGRGIGLADHQEFNTRLLDGIQRLQTLFWPSGSRAAARASRSDLIDLRALGGGGPEMDLSPLLDDADEPDDPFEAFIDDLLADDPGDGPAG